MQVCLFAEFANESLLAHVTVYHVKKLKSINLLNVCHAQPVDLSLLHCDHIECTKTTDCSTMLQQVHVS